MFNLDLTGIKSLLCLGAHSDDIEIGAGASILKLTRENPGLHVHWVVFSAKPPRDAEARSAASAFLSNAGSSDIVLHEFRDSYFPDQWAAIKDELGNMGRETRPDLVLTHSMLDQHQDHRVIAELTWNVFRNHLVLEYEIPKFDGDLGRPNFFVPATERDFERKMEIIETAFASQAGKDWFDKSLFHGLMRIRGMECRSPSLLAEAFYARKLRSS